MSINGIGEAGYPAVGYEKIRKTERNVSGGSFAKQAAAAAQGIGRAAAVLHGSDEEMGDIAICSNVDIVNNSSITVYKTPDFDSDNPVYKVKIWDKDGNVTERMVDVSKVDPKNCDTVEMYAYTSHLKESGKGSFEDTVLKAAVAKAVKNAEQRNSGSFNLSTKMDWVDTVKDIMQSEYRYGDLKGYMDWKKFYTALLNNLASSAVRNVGPAYKTYESENYRIVPDNEAGCFDIYNKQGERLGAFEYSDIKVRQDGTTGKQFLISEHGTMSYDAVVMDGELKAALQEVMGVETLETEELSGFTLKTHSGTGIQYLLRDGEDGRGGKVLLQSETDRERYEALAEIYFNKYPELIHDKNAAYIWADLEIKELAQRTKDGILSMGFNGITTESITGF